jgi:DNA adenine methylase
MPTSALSLRHETTSPTPAQPFIKWVGGKGRLLHKLEPMLPPGAALMRHVEPFMGGGALFFARAPERALLCDVNRSLVRTYEAVRDDVEGVIGELNKLARLGHDDKAFYAAREGYNSAKRKTDREHAALFIYLNKTCFNGLHRVNRRGEFNVPHGKYKNPRIVDTDGLRSASLALANAELKTTGFEALLESARPGDFVYFDPPYAPMSDTANFTAYAQEGFGLADQARLRDVFRELDRRGCRLMLSNSDVPVIRDLYREWNIDTIMAPRAVSASAAGRASVSEVVVRNY